MVAYVRVVTCGAYSVVVYGDGGVWHPGQQSPVTQPEGEVDVGRSWREEGQQGQGGRVGAAVCPW